MDQTVQPITGILDAFWEQGTEGIIWTVYDPAHNTADGKRQYSGLSLIENGDKLRVFNDAAKQQVLWEGEVDLDYKCDVVMHHIFPQVVSQRIDGSNVHGIPHNMNPSEWYRLFREEKPCELIKVTPAP